jgi:hypothetical protein
MSAGIKANLDGSGAIQVGGTDYITISSSGAVAIPVSLTVGGIPAGGNYILNQYTSPTTWDGTTKKAAGLKAVKVTAVGAGGNGVGNQFGTSQQNSGSDAKRNYIANNIDCSDSQIYIIYCTNIDSKSTNVSISLQWRELY